MRDADDRHPLRCGLERPAFQEGVALPRLSRDREAARDDPRVRVRIEVNANGARARAAHRKREPSATAPPLGDLVESRVEHPRPPARGRLQRRPQRALQLEDALGVQLDREQIAPAVRELEDA